MNFCTEAYDTSTEAYDRGEKFRKYRSLPSFKEYVLITQEEACVETFHKTDEKSWMINTYLGLDTLVKLRSIDVEIPMKEIYRNVGF